MIDNKKFSVLITTHKRFRNLGTVLKAWLNTKADEIILIDNSGGKALTSYYIKDIIEQEKRINLITVFKDYYKTRMDYAIAGLTNGDFIIYADDDVVPKKGFVTDLYEGYKNSQLIHNYNEHMYQDIRYPAPMVGIIGRTFHGPKYKGDTVYYRSSKVSEPVRTGFVGVIYMCARQYAYFDTKGLYCPNIDELYHELECFPNVPCYVVPSVNYEDLPEASDNTAMFHNPLLKKQRHEYYAKMYEKNKTIYQKLWGSNE